LASKAILNFRFSIFDCQLAATASDRGLSTRHEYRGKLTRFFLEWFHTHCAHQSGIDDQFQPEGTFVRFLFYDARPVDEIRS
jgi:hypothetical protein